MASLPPSRRFGLTQDPQPSPLTTYERYSFSSRSSSLGDDTPDKGSPAYFGGDLSPITPRRERTSRYLSEGDRKEIIARVDGGEKQVALAKEFNVSRAAICNLYKNRWEVLTRGVRDPTATHPKKSRKKSSPGQTTTVHTSTVAAMQTTASSPISIQANESPVSQPQHYNQTLHRNLLQDEVNPRDQGTHHTLDRPGPSKRFLVHEASAYSYPCRTLVATLRDESISSIIFQQRAMRLARLLIEEALTCLPHDEEEITNKYGDLCHTTKALDASDFCAVSMEDRDMVLLRAFSDISPTSPTGVVSIETRFFESSLSPPQFYAQLPPINQQQFVLLLDIECAAGEKACAMLHHLVNDRQIPARNIYFVTVISDFEGLQNVFRHLPDVSLVTAQVDTVLDEQRIRPGISDFLQRYWDVNSPG